MDFRVKAVIDHFEKHYGSRGVGTNRNWYHSHYSYPEDVNLSYIISVIVFLSAYLFAIVFQYVD